MLAKLSADILDRLDIFILEIEELQVPEVSISSVSVMYMYSFDLFSDKIWFEFF
jgi:hypothetical protein